MGVNDRICAGVSSAVIQSSGNPMLSVIKTLASDFSFLACLLATAGVGFSRCSRDVAGAISGGTGKDD